MHDNDLTGLLKETLEELSTRHAYDLGNGIINDNNKVNLVPNIMKPEYLVVTCADGSSYEFRPVEENSQWHKDMLVVAYYEGKTHEPLKELSDKCLAKAEQLFPYPKKEVYKILATAMKLYFKPSIASFFGINYFKEKNRRKCFDNIEQAFEIGYFPNRRSDKIQDYFSQFFSHLHTLYHTDQKEIRTEFTKRAIEIEKGEPKDEGLLPLDPDQKNKSGYKVMIDPDALMDLWHPVPTTDKRLEFGRIEKDYWLNWIREIKKNFDINNVLARHLNIHFT